ncbi:MAG: glucose-6-phosphate dehydrogenase assembly protein OpcA [Chloroflexi bacterium]|nr:glucose-6-phosphate dehydrogenase assembly protein OpcA [Chloroflexota bacterium]
MTDLSFTQDETYVVQPREIESLLKRLWNEANGEGEESPVMQVRTQNLLAFIPSAFSNAETLRAIDAASVQHPGRTITMIATDDEQAPVANVAIACRIGSGGKQLCGEQIAITCGYGGEPLPSIAASLTVPGVPVFLWWHGDPPFTSQVFDSLVETADRVILDSRSWNAPFETLKELAQHSAKHAPHIAYTDLHWTRLTPWRRQTAQCFDLPDALPQLYRLRQVTIEHGSDDHDYVEALLFVGWLASGLNWKIGQSGNGRLTMRGQNTTVAIDLRRREHSDGLQAVTLSSADAEFKLSYVPETECVRTEITLPGAMPIERVARFKAQPLEAMISEELNMLDRDRHFERALQIAAEIVGGEPRT